MRKYSIPLYWQIIIGLILGIIYALLSSFFKWSAFTNDWIAPWGTVFIDLLKLVAVPLVLFSIMSGIASLGSPKQLGKIGIRTLLVYLTTTVLAISIGLLLANIIGPGNKLDKELQTKNRINYELWAKSENIPVHDGKCLSCDTVNENIIESIERSENKSDKNIEALTQKKESSPLDFIFTLVPSNIFQVLIDEKSMLKVIFFAVFFGIALLLTPREKTGTLVNVIDSLSEVFIKMVDIIMRAAPFFVFALMAGVISEQANDQPSKVIEIFKGLGWYSITVVLGLFLVAFVLYPLFVKIFIKGVSFKEFIKGISPAQLLAFSTSSSAATLPVTMECVEENLKVDKRVASFVLPIGATVNMDGTSLYQSVAVMFLAQMHGIDLDLFQQITIVFTAVMASIGSAAVPSAGIVMLMIVLSSVGLNPAWIAIILPVDRILDMCRTTVNVTGDAIVSLVIDRTSQLD